MSRALEAVNVSEVSREQVAAFRLARHHLSRRVAQGGLVSACGDVVGVQAQVLSAARLSLRARVKGITAEDVDRSLWKDRTLVKTWAMRGTLHLLPAADLMTTLRGLQGNAHRDLRGWVRWTGLPAKEIERIIGVVVAALKDRPMTRHELADAVVAQVGEKARRWIEHSWGGLVSSACRLGLVCFGPPRGSEVTFVRREHWLPHARVPRSSAGAWLLRRYLGSYGPASAQDAAAWSGRGTREMRSFVEGLGEEVVAVETEGGQGWILREDVRALETARLASSCVNLLPNFDTFLLGHRRKDAVVDPTHVKKVSRAAGWVSATVLVDGRVSGTWSMERVSRRLEVQIEPFAAVSRGIREAVAAEVQDIGRFLGEDAEPLWVRPGRV